MDPLNETVLLKTKITLFNLLIRETSQFLCYERLLNMTYVTYKNAFFREMQFWSHCYTVVSYQALFRLSVYKIQAVYLSGAKNVCFFTIRDFGSPSIMQSLNIKDSKLFELQITQTRQSPTHFGWKNVLVQHPSIIRKYF